SPDRHGQLPGPLPRGAGKYGKGPGWSGSGKPTGNRSGRRPNPEPASHSGRCDHRYGVAVFEPVRKPSPSQRTLGGDLTNTAGGFCAVGPVEPTSPTL